MAQLFKADPGRRVELEGVGPAPRPVDIDQARRLGLQPGITVPADPSRR